MWSAFILRLKLPDINVYSRLIKCQLIQVWRDIWPGREKRAGVLYFGLKTQIEQKFLIDSYTYYDITNYRYINFICARDRS